MIGIKVTTQLKEILDREAAKEHRPLANFVKHAILTFLKEHKKIDFREE